VPRLLLVRHASAGARSTAPGDLDRPLDEHGAAQAAALPSLLSPLLDAGAAIHASPARRCIDTVTPLAAALGTSVIVDEALVEGADVRGLLGRLTTLERGTVWSSHGDVIPELLAMLARRGLDLGDDPTCSKASTWVIDLVGGAAMSARHLAPPSGRRPG
jgi:8-oxo-(d)GTP phosphatase